MSCFCSRILFWNHLCVLTHQKYWQKINSNIVKHPSETNQSGVSSFWSFYWLSEKMVPSQYDHYHSHLVKSGIKAILVPTYPAWRLGPTFSYQLTSTTEADTSHFTDETGIRTGSDGLHPVTTPDKNLGGLCETSHLWKSPDSFTAVT